MKRADSRDRSGRNETQNGWKLSGILLKRQNQVL